MADNETSELMLFVIGAMLFSMLLAGLAVGTPKLIDAFNNFTQTHHGDF